MRIVDDVVLDPAEFIPEREELNLSEMGLTVLEANWGESAIEAFMVRQALGEIPADRHLPNRQVELALAVREEGSVDLPTAAYRLQQKVGRLQLSGGWMRRDFYVGGRFAGSLGCRVRHAAFANLSNWQQGDSPNVVLKLVTGPLWYATEEVEGKVFTSEERSLVVEIPQVEHFE